MPVSKNNLNTSGNSASINYLLGFFFVLALVSCKTVKPDDVSWVVSPPMVCIDYYPISPDSNILKVSFRESQRAYRLDPVNDKNHEYADLLEESWRKKTKVIITRVNDQSSEIIKVEKAR